MPGDGIVPVWEIMRAILDTGYDGVITDEISATHYVDWDPLDVTKALKRKGDAVLASL
jgi:sugar phosphate isomerase/epimerase